MLSVDSGYGLEAVRGETIHHEVSIIVHRVFKVV